MTLDEAIKHANEVADEHTEYYASCDKYAEKYRQLAEWLDELKQLREQMGWIPVSKRPPEENIIVIASTDYGVYPEARYTKENGWEWAYESLPDYHWAELAGVTAWMPLPKQYKAESEET